MGVVNVMPWKPTVSSSGVTISAPRKSPIHQDCTLSQKSRLAATWPLRTLTATKAQASVDAAAAAAKARTWCSRANEMGPRMLTCISQTPSSAGGELDEVQQAGQGVFELRRGEGFIREDLGQEPEAQHGRPVARRVQQEKGEQRTGGGPEQAHLILGEQREASAYCDEMDGKVDCPRLQGT